MIRRLLRARPSALREGLALERTRARRLRREALAPAHAGVSLVGRTPAGDTLISGVATPIAAVGRAGAFTSFIELPTRSRVLGLIPDGVATIDLTCPRIARPGGRRYPAALRFTETVEGNVVGYNIARSATDALSCRQVWRAADGSVVRTLDQNGDPVR